MILLSTRKASPHPGAQIGRGLGDGRVNVIVARSVWTEAGRGLARLFDAVFCFAEAVGGSADLSLEQRMAIF